MSSPKAADHITTRIISHRTLTVDGVEVTWWAVGEHPSLVTVRTAVFGSQSVFTFGDLEACALKLARELLAQHYTRARAAYKDVEAKRTKSSVPALKRPGWFDLGADFTSTKF